MEVSWQFYKLKMCFGYEQIENELEASYVGLAWQQAILRPVSTLLVGTLILVRSDAKLYIYSDSS